MRWLLHLTNEETGTGVPLVVIDRDGPEPRSDSFLLTTL